MSKYNALHNHLLKIKADSWQAAFSDIEKILKFSLPNSARQYPAWWANQEHGAQCSSWLRAGWITSDLNLSKGTITFVRKSGVAHIERKKPRNTHDYSKAVTNILNHYQAYDKAFRESGTFTGPSVYFHCKAMSLRDGEDIERFLEAVYAVLVSWGMHRMGARGAKMVHFSDFYKSVISVWNEIEQAKKFDCQKITEDQWSLIEKIYDGIQIMKGQTHIVGRSKVMAHLLPNIIAPVDRQYTLSFLHGNKNIKINDQWELLKSIMVNYYYELEKDKELQQFSDGLIKNNNGSGWNTSRLKIIDNLVIGAVKKNKM